MLKSSSQLLTIKTISGLKSEWGNLQLICWCGWRLKAIWTCSLNVGFVVMLSPNVPGGNHPRDEALLALTSGRDIKNIKGKEGSNEFRGKWTLMALALLMFQITNYWKFDKHTKWCGGGRGQAEVLSTYGRKTISAHLTIFNNRTDPLRKINVIMKSLWKWQITVLGAALGAFDNNEIRCTGSEKKHSR